MLVLFAVSLSGIGCDKLKGLKFTSEELASALQTYGEVIKVDERAGRLSSEEAERLRGKFSGISYAYAPVNSEIQSLTKLDGDAALRVLPSAIAFARALDEENVINLSNPLAAGRYSRVVALLRILAGRIVSRLKSKLSSPAQLREFERDVRELKRLLAA